MPCDKLHIYAQPCTSFEKRDDEMITAWTLTLVVPACIELAIRAWARVAYGVPMNVRNCRQQIKAW